MTEMKATKEKYTDPLYVCAACGEMFAEEDLLEFDGETYCADCLDERTDICACCGERIWHTDRWGDCETALCRHCYDHRYTDCESCGVLLFNDDAYYDENNNAYCEDCYEKHQQRSIKSYYYKPEPLFYGSGPLFMGIELEIDKGGEDNRNAETLLGCANGSCEHIYCKHDGSIDDGFEIVSHPMTLDYHTDIMNWKEVFDTALSLDYRSHQTSTCGLHIHVNRSAFGKDICEQEETVARIVYFVEQHWNELLKFSRRTEASMNRWAARYGIAQNTKDTYRNAKDRCPGRYAAVNLENETTVEFRIFRGTLRYTTFMAALELVHEICRFAIQLDDKRMEALSWSEFVSLIPPDKEALIEYLKAKRLYVNETVYESEDM